MGACTTTIKDDGFNCTGNPALSCQSTNSSGTIYYGCYTSDFGGTWAHSSFACYTSQNCIVSVALSGVTCKATVTTCSTPSERDSLICVQDGKIWDVDPVTGVTTCLEKPTDCNWTVSTIPVYVVLTFLQAVLLSVKTVSVRACLTLCGGPNSV